MVEKRFEEKKVDPEDGGSYTLAELMVHYAGTYKKKELQAYWDNTCKATKGKGKTTVKAEVEEKKIDPEDGAAYTQVELMAHYAGKFKKKDLEMYWADTCTATKQKGKTKAKPESKAKAKSKQKPKQEHRDSRVRSDTMVARAVMNGQLDAKDAVFAWMGWGPKIDSPCFRSLHSHFEGALPGTALFHRTKLTLTGEKYGFTPENTLYGQSICPDEINNEKGDLADIMKEFWGECFPFGGIGGPPFVGKTGFMAFSHHVPDNGNIVIMFGPHIAISESGEVGKYLRAGQHEESTACGAILAAYSQCCSGKVGRIQDDLHDVQQAWLRMKLNPHCARIQEEAHPMAALAHQAYAIVAESVNEVVNLDFGSGCLVLIGGIQINMPDPCEDHFLPKLFEVRSKDRPMEDLLHVMKM